MHGVHARTQQAQLAARARVRTCDCGVDGLEAPPQLLEQQEAGELGRAGALQELDEDLARRPAQLLSGRLELLVAHKVALVVVGAHLGQERLQLRLLLGRDVGGVHQRGHGLKVCARAAAGGGGAQQIQR